MTGKSGVVYRGRPVEELDRDELIAATTNLLDRIDEMEGGYMDTLDALAAKPGWSIYGRRKIGRLAKRGRFMELPDWGIRHRWVKVDKDPGGKKIGRYSMIVDRCYWPEFSEKAGQIHSLHIAYVRDHPFLEELNHMEHAPRAVKAIYRKEVRLRHLLTTEAWGPIEDIDRAYEAWGKYCRRKRSNNQPTGDRQPSNRT